MLIIASCSKDEPTIEQKAELFTRMQQGEVAAVINRTDYHQFFNLSNTDYNWRETGTDFNVIPSHRFMPVTLIVKDGKTWTTYTDRILSGNTFTLNMLWNVYCSQKQIPKTVYIYCPIELSEDFTHVTLDGKVCEILNSSSNSFQVCYMTDPYLDAWGEEHPSRFKEIVTYTISQESLPNLDKYLWFNNKQEAARYKFEVTRNYFGEKFDINTYIYPNRLDDSIIDMAELEAGLKDDGII